MEFVHACGFRDAPKMCACLIPVESVVEATSSLPFNPGPSDGKVNVFDVSKASPIMTPDTLHTPTRYRRAPDSCTNWLKEVSAVRTLISRALLSRSRSVSVPALCCKARLTICRGELGRVGLISFYSAGKIFVWSDHMCMYMDDCLEPCQTWIWYL